MEWEGKERGREGKGKKERKGGERGKEERKKWKEGKEGRERKERKEERKGGIGEDVKKSETSCVAAVENSLVLAQKVKHGTTIIQKFHFTVCAQKGRGSSTHLYPHVHSSISPIAKG